MSNDSDQTNLNSATSDQEANTVYEHQQVDRQPVARQPVESQPIYTAEEPVYIRQVEEEEPGNSTFSELVKFGIMAVILLGIPLVIALLIPLIFGQIVPAILGTNLPANTQILPGDQVIQPPTAETPNVVLPTDPQTGIGGEEVVNPTPTPLETATATPEIETHVVRSGETLSSIARQYGLSSDEIATANNILDPNQIYSGQILTLPPASNPE